MKGYGEGKEEGEGKERIMNMVEKKNEKKVEIGKIKKGNKNESWKEKKGEREGKMKKEKRKIKGKIN